MHAIHTTPGFIIDSRPYGEAGKLISIFTRDFGLVIATAQGIRFEKSKLRYHSQDYSFGSFSLVRGREFWRLTSAAEKGSRSGAVSREDIMSQPARELVARLALLLRRLLQGEEANPQLFACIESAGAFIHGHGMKTGSAKELDDERLKTLESLTVIRMMHCLGYIGDTAGLNGHVGSAELSVAMLDELGPKRAAMNRAVNAALKETHL